MMMAKTINKTITIAPPPSNKSEKNAPPARIKSIAKTITPNIRLKITSPIMVETLKRVKPVSEPSGVLGVREAEITSHIPMMGKAANAMEKIVPKENDIIMGTNVPTVYKMHASKKNWLEPWKCTRCKKPVPVGAVPMGAPPNWGCGGREGE